MKVVRIATAHAAPLAHRIEDACVLVGCSKTTLYAAVAAKELRTFKLGRLTLILDSELRDFLARKAAAGNVIESERMRAVRARNKARPVRQPAPAKAAA